MQLLVTLMTACPEELVPHYSSIITLCSQTLVNQTNHTIAYYAIQ